MVASLALEAVEQGRPPQGLKQPLDRWGRSAGLDPAAGRPGPSALLGARPGGC